MIQIDHLHFSYTDAPPWILSRLDFAAEDGAYISVVGDNGSGKSTLIRLLLGFLQPTSGTLAVGTKDVGYVPQRRDGSDRDFPLTVYESLNAYRRLKRLSSDDLTDALDHVDLLRQQKTLVGNLSGGQQQKLLIARALMGDPPLLILDEPSTGIDPASQQEIYALLSHLNKVHGTTIVSVEHNLEAAVKNSTSIYHLHDGHGHLCSPEQYRDEYLS